MAAVKMGAARQIDESLRRLQTTHVDLIQFHEIIRMDDPDKIFAPGGALEAALAAKQPAKRVILDSPATKIRPFICTCWSWRKRIIFILTPCKCR